MTAHQSKQGGRLMGMIKVDKFDKMPDGYDDALKACLKAYPVPPTDWASGQVETLQTRTTARPDLRFAGETYTRVSPFDPLRTFGPARPVGYHSSISRWAAAAP